ncbi:MULTISPECIES: carbohydrate ABC transporter permease [Carnobacterium]|uniref:Carbohydrate ABC transporter permease n=1 Tax=Carnobacterium antarcticum TaxID=2126436 RepID=A0ABW4NKB2_9LACT|nr:MULTISPECIES: carbohydrate ABC transporter permease [unclassified Carnobacterium]ALV21993.1 lactose transport system [Carnobacterium sp. CP1]QQP69960.1 carbohydrate ABC transporter permease [Carnobacterium sp. CS13]
MKSKILTPLKYLFLIICSIISIFPFYWMVAGATNTSNQIAEGKITLGNQFLVNLKSLFEGYNIPLIMWNSIKVTLITVVLSLLVTSLAAFGFEKFKTRKSEIIYSIFLLFMMIPFAALVIPLFKMMAGFHLVNQHLALILPSVSNLFLIFFFRQSFKSFPNEIIDSGRIEGAGSYGIFFRLVFPMMKSTYAAATIYSFMNSWNSYLLPLIILQTEDKYTMTLLISGLSSASYVANYGVQMVAIVIATIPTLILFVAMQKSFVAGMTGSIKA